MGARLKSVRVVARWGYARLGYDTRKGSKRNHLLMNAILPRLLILAGCWLVAGCAGELSIWGINVCVDGTVPPCDGNVGGDDDDDDASGLDLSVYDGTEWLNIEWTPEALADGLSDCKEAWTADGVEFTGDTDELCIACDNVWTVTLTHAPALGDEGCLRQGTGIDILTSYQRRIGMRHRGGGEFTMYRNRPQVSSPLGQSLDDRFNKIGVGAFKGASWTFAGEPTDVVQVTARRYSFFFSGEGDF
jgi:hypothetical protein